MDRIEQIIAAMKAQGASAHDIETYLTQHEGLTPEPAPYTPAPTGHAGKRFVNAPDAFDQMQPSVGEQIGGGIAAIAKDIPGAEAAQAGVRALIRRQSYPQALADIQGAEDAAPTGVRRLNRAVGGTIAGLALPSIAGKTLPAAAASRVAGSGALQGAIFGGASGALNSAPLSESGAGDRFRRGAIGAGVGALVGGGTDRVLTLVRGGAPGAVAAGGRALAASGRVLDAVKNAAQRGGRSLINRAPSVGHEVPAETLESVLAKADAALKARGIHEVGPTYGDAEEAMGLAPHQQPDLEEQLRQSLAAAGGGTPLNKMRAETPFTGFAGGVAPEIRSGITGPGELDPALFEQGRANLDRGNAVAERANILADLKNAPSHGGSLLKRALRGAVMADAGAVVPRVNALDRQLGTVTPSVLRALGITALTPSSQ